MRLRPFSFDISLAHNWAAQFDRRMERRLSALRGQFMDRSAYDELIAAGDPLIYEVFEILRPERTGELLSGLSVLHAGKVGSEYFMTKGHFHAARETAEIYYCLRGAGLLLMENEKGDWAAEEFRPGRIVYVTPGWAHRSINTGPSEDLITFFAYPGHAGHDYASIEMNGFRKAVVEKEGAVSILDNPSWSNAAPVGL